VPKLFNRRRVLAAVGYGLAGTLTGAPPAGGTEVEPLVADFISRWSVPGASTAIVRDGVVSAHVAGTVRSDQGTPVTPQTLFQAASLSKSIAAVAALILVQRGTLALDTDVNKYLTTWKLPSSPLSQSNPVTLRRLLSMSGGINVPGYAGYPPGAPLPRLAQILDGAPPANSEPVRVTYPPGSKQVYSGGGYEIVEAVIESVTGTPFGRVAHDLVLGPAGMSSSRFDQPLPPGPSARAAWGHYLDGRPMPGGGNVFPELAAAGLWSTPSDLARFLTMLSNAHRASADALLSPEILREMLRPTGSLNYGLGGVVSGSGRGLVFMKRGHNLGFNNTMLIFPETGQGAVVMTNSENAYGMLQPLINRFAADYNWPPYPGLLD
jgi:CubicO group peptidase (beta-lactamase class C family)